MEINMYPTLIVGIGGSGKLTCKFLKKKFQERFPKEWLEPATGLPPIVDIVVIETEPGREKEETRLPELPDVLTIAAHVNEDTLKAMQKSTYLNKNPEIKNWLSAPLPIDAIIGGAGQIRQAGRLAFFYHRKAFGRIEEIIFSKIDNIKSDLAMSKMRKLSNDQVNIPDTRVRCYIISSVCGGTGSGMLLDIAGLVKKKNCKTNLIAFLPKMFESVIDLPQSVYLLQANAYATLKEINHYMTGGKWEVWYKEREMDGVFLDGKLFDYCFLVDNESETTNLGDRLHISPLVAEFVFLAISELEHPLTTSEVNIKKFSEVNTSNWCNGLGISTILFPLEEIVDIMVNWAVRDLILKDLSVDFSIDEIKDEILNPNYGLLSPGKSYEKWENAILAKTFYNTKSVDTIIKQSGSLVSKVQGEKNRLEREHADDVRRMKESFEKYIPKVKEEYSQILDDRLKEKGPAYLKIFSEELKKELNNLKSNLESEVQKLSQKSASLEKLISDDLSLLGKIEKEKPFIAIGWRKKVDPHIQIILVRIKELFDTKLKTEKYIYSIQIVKELIDLLEKKNGEYSSLDNKLNSIRMKKQIDEERLWNILTFSSAAEIKVKSRRDDVTNFYNTYLRNELKGIGAQLRGSLFSWMKESIENIEKEMENTIRKKISDIGFDKLTILDAMKDEMEDLGKNVNECMNNKSLPFIKHAGQPREDRFFVCGLESFELAKLPPLPSDVVVLSSNIEKTKRRLSFVRLSSNFSLSDMATHRLQDYANAYGELIQKFKWIHILPEARGFQDPLGLSIGMEEEALIRTCQDVGIIFQKGSYHFEYKNDRGQDVVLAQGLENAIKELQDEPSTANYLKQKLLDFFNNEKLEKIKEYLDDHDPTNFVGIDADSKYRKNHEDKYKDKGNGVPIPVHSIPSYILTELKKRLERK
jgi:hypothetical protein